MMELVFQTQDLISYFHPRKKVNRLRFGMECHTLLAIEPFQLWLRIYIFNFGKNDGGIFHDEFFMMEVPDGDPYHIETSPLICRAKNVLLYLLFCRNLFLCTKSKQNLAQVSRSTNFKLEKRRPSSHKVFSWYPPRFRKSNKYNPNIQHLFFCIQLFVTSTAKN